MKTSKLSSLLDKDLKIVEKKKIFFLIPLGIVVLTAILMVIYNFTLGSPLNLGMDFAGGYSINVKIGPQLTDSTASYYKNNIKDVMVKLTDEDGASYGIKISKMQTQDAGENASIRVTYTGTASEDDMVNINTKLAEALRERIGSTLPTEVTVDEAAKTVKFDYDEVINDNRLTLFKGNIVEVFKGKDVTVTESGIVASEDKKSIIVTCSTVEGLNVNELKTEIALADPYNVTVGQGNSVGATIQKELLYTALLAIVIAIVLMLIYIAIRFEPSSGVAAIVALFHDLIIMMCFMIIFRVEITSTFIAALITILGYSINNTIIIFDRVRENIKNMLTGKSIAKGSYDLIANRSVTETMLRSLNTTLTTLLTIGMVALIGVYDIKIFALPIIIGLLAGTYSSICIAPPIWTLLKNKLGLSKKEKRAAKAKDADKAIAA